MMAVCPKCDIALILMEFADVQIDYCPQCEGLWLDSGEIEQLLIRTGGRYTNDPLLHFIQDGARGEVGRPLYLCPRCDRPLKEVANSAQSGVELRLDRCPRGDGIWFDKNELHLLLQSFPDQMQANGALSLLAEVLGTYTEQQQEREPNWPTV